MPRFASHSNPHFQIMVAQLLLQLGEFEEATEAAHRAVRLEPVNAHFLNVFAHAFGAQRRPAGGSSLGAKGHRACTRFC